MLIDYSNLNKILFINIPKRKSRMSVEIIRTYLSLAREQLATKNYLAAIQNYEKVIYQLQYSPLIKNINTRLMLAECYLDLATCYICIDDQPLYIDCLNNGVSRLESITIIELNSLSHEELDSFYRCLIRYYKEDRILFLGDLKSKFTYLFQCMGFLGRYNDLPRDKTNRYSSHLYYLCQRLNTRLNYPDPTLIPFSIHFAEAIVYKIPGDITFLADAYHDMALVYEKEKNKLSVETCCLRSLYYRWHVCYKSNEEYKLIGETFRLLAKQYDLASLHRNFYQICEQILSDYENLDEDEEQLNIDSISGDLQIPSIDIETVISVFSLIDRFQETMSLLFKHKQQLLQLLCQTATDNEFPKTSLRNALLQHYFPQLFDLPATVNELIRPNSTSLNATPWAEDNPVLAQQHVVNIPEDNRNADNRRHDLNDLMQAMRNLTTRSKL